MSWRPTKCYNGYNGRVLAGPAPGDPMATPLWKANLLLRAFGVLKVPLIGHLRTRIVEHSDDHTVVKVPLRRRSKNHWGTMYFGALAVGADVAGGWAAMEAILDAKKRTGADVGFVFRDVQAEFLRRPDGHVHFTCRDVPAMRELIEAAVADGERHDLPVEVVATVPSHSDDPVARFTLTLSVKARGEK